MITSPVPVYPSQLDTIKSIAKDLADLIGEEVGSKRLSAFKRNDYLANALGYKGYPDLVESTKFRALGDKNETLSLFHGKGLSDSIATTFAGSVPGLTPEAAANICKTLAAREAASVRLSELKHVLGNVSREEAEAVKANSNFNMFLDDESFNPISYDGVRELNRLVEQSTPKNDNVEFAVNLSGVPDGVKFLISKHPVYVRFVKFIQSQDEGVKFTEICSNKLREDNRKWKIGAKADTWSKVKVTPEVLSEWERFSDWLNGFYPTGRVIITQRINTHRWVSMHTQYAVDDPVNYARSRLSASEDIELFSYLLRE
ncbi:hypothetical protein [Salinimonas chungwhensis]|uniref:hypothetical protein n=1 Tax=Salinimonas chungwhensis TaxID=265425 RepID=UPI00036DC776|nr:hypothetical protein [Salinimonas chungwhensis]